MGQGADEQGRGVSDVEVSGDRASVRLDLRVYRLAAIKAAAYRLAAQCTIAIENVNDDYVDAVLLFRKSPTEAGVREAICNFHQELLDQELREQLRQETEPVRALILAQAFSRTNLIDRR